MISVYLPFLKRDVVFYGRDELKEHLIQTLYNKSNFRLMMLDEKKAFKALFSKEWKGILSKTDIFVCASQMVAWMVRMLCDKKIPVVMPVTVFLDFMRVSNEMNYTIFLYGGDNGVIIETVKKIRKSFPGSRIVGYYRANIKGKEEEDVLVNIRKSAPQIFFVSMNSVFKQERWIEQNRNAFAASVIVSVDNSFWIIAGKKKMPPLWVQKKNLNGLYKILVSPYNLLRIFRLLVLFFYTVVKRIFKKKPA
ncbi:MAG: WecB/TagA/CpsF family glycosyltransferase [Brevinematia bacterium]